MIEHLNYPNGTIYLSGGMEHAEDLGSAWREVTSEKLKTMGFFPLDITSLDKAYQKEHGDTFSIELDGTEMSLLRKKANIRKHFIHADLQLIENNSDALIVLYDESVRKGAGTISECQVAFNNDIPIFIVSAYPDYSSIPGWLLALSTKVFFTFPDLYDYLKLLPKGILKRDKYGNHCSEDYYLCSLSGEPFKKEKTHFVSKVSPLYSKYSVEIVKKTHEEMKDRYEFFIEYLNQEKVIK